MNRLPCVCTFSDKRFIVRWNPHEESMIFLNYSALLYAQYYTLQITVHRPFIPSPRKPSRTSFPSLAICTNAARSTIHVLDVQFQRAQRCPKTNEVRVIFMPPFLRLVFMCQQYHHSLSPIQALFTAGMVLFLNIWGGRRIGSVSDFGKDIQDLHKVVCMMEKIGTR